MSSETEGGQEYDQFADPAYVKALHRKIRRLESEQEEMRDRIDKLEAGGSGSGSGSSSSSGEIGAGLDKYDRQALENLTPGQKVTLAQLRSAYQGAGIRNKSTLQSRIKTITKRPAFDYNNGNSWVYDPDTEPEAEEQEGDDDE